MIERWKNIIATRTRSHLKTELFTGLNKQINGQTSFSQIVFWKQTAGDISVYPVPNPGDIYGIAGVNDFNNYNITIRDMSENTVFFAENIYKSMVLPSMKPGYYFINITQKYTTRVTIIRYVKL